jgi:1-acyl-sn-glycerol-3-phosphate acyltransferase
MATGILFSNTKPKWIYQVPKTGSKILLNLFGSKTIVDGEEFLDFTKPKVYVSNHSSNLDFLIIPALMPAMVKLLGKEELVSYPVIGTVMKHLYITVRRNDHDDRALCMQKMKDALNEGYSIFIFPEGTRNNGANELRSFYDGAFKLSIEAQVPIQALTIFNASERVKPRSSTIYPGPVYCSWSKEFNTEGLNINHIESLKQTVKRDIQEKLDEYYGARIPQFIGK